MKYRHRFHAGNFADVHKHVALLALLAALGRKEKGFLYLETHAGPGACVPAAAGDHVPEAQAGIDRLATAQVRSETLRRYMDRIAAFRKVRGDARIYPGSPLLAAGELRPQDRAIAVEIQPAEAHALERALGKNSRMRVERGDGFERLRAHLPPRERRGLTFIDPPYEETRRDFQRVTAAAGEALRRFASGIVCIWYPIKEDRELRSWKRVLADALNRDVLFSELWLYPRDSRVGLNGSGLAIVNPPFQFAERADEWLAELREHLDPTGAGGVANVLVTPAAAAGATR